MEDYTLFGEAIASHVRTIKDVLQEYEINSGQCVNVEKSSIFFTTNIKDNERLQFSNSLGVRFSKNPKKYLDLPNMVGQMKKASFQNLKDIMQKKVDGWSFRFLSQSGKEVFIKSILQTIPTYTITCFLLPKSLCDNFEKTMA